MVVRLAGESIERGEVEVDRRERGYKNYSEMERMCFLSFREEKNQKKTNQKEKGIMERKRKNNDSRKKRKKEKERGRERERERSSINKTK